MLEGVVLAQLHEPAQKRADELYVDLLLAKVTSSFDVILPVQLKHDKPTASLRKFNLSLLLELRASHDLALSLLIHEHLVHPPIGHLLSEVLVEVDMVGLLIDPISDHEIFILERSRN